MSKKTALIIQSSFLLTVHVFSAIIRAELHKTVRDHPVSKQNYGRNDGRSASIFCAMKISVKKISRWAILAALYASITLLTAAFSFGPIQFRVAEALSVLCCFVPHLSVGITLGCFIANLFSTVSALDILVGTLATAVSCFLMTRRKNLLLALLPNVLVTGIFIGAMLAFCYTPNNFWPAFWLYFGQVALGEAVVMTLLGLPLYLFLRKSPRTAAYGG